MRKPHVSLDVLIFLAFMLNACGPMPHAQAQEFRLPTPGVMVDLSPEFDPPLLRGLKVDSMNPFHFEFILDRGEDKSNDKKLRLESTKLVKYFLASLTVPANDLWVNLSPYEKDRIIPQSFGLTEMGRDLLAEDYMLKQITASLIYPEGATGKIFWKRVYEKAARQFGTTNIPVNTFNKVWIVPQKAVVWENARAKTAYVLESQLKVMLEEDYLALSKNQRQQNHTINDNINELGSQVVRQIIIPELTREVNQGKHFVQLRQVYNALILAAWYKKKVHDGILAQVYADKNKVNGVGYSSSVIAAGIAENDTVLIYRRYLKAFKKGVFNFIEDTQTPKGTTVPRKYFSGGLIFGHMDEAMTTTTDFPQGEENRELLILSVNLDRATNPATRLDRQGAASSVDHAMQGAQLLSGINDRAMLVSLDQGNVRVSIDDVLNEHHALAERIAKVVNEVLQHNAIPKGVAKSGRSIIIPLSENEQFTAMGKVFKSIRLKGSNFQGQAPVMLAYTTEKGNITGQPSDRLMIEKVAGKDIIMEQPGSSNPQGALYLSGAESEYRNGRMVFEAGIPTALPIGIGEYTGMNFDGKKVGFSILAEEDDPLALRLGDVLNRKLNQNSTQTYYDDLSRGTISAARILRRFNDKGFIHFSAHLDQFDYQENISRRIYDFNVMYMKGQGNMKRDEFIYRLMVQFFSFYRSVDKFARINDKIPWQAAIRIPVVTKVYEDILNGYFSSQEIDNIKQAQAKMRGPVNFISVALKLFVKGRVLRDLIEEVSQEDPVMAEIAQVAGRIYDGDDKTKIDKAMFSGKILNSPVFINPVNGGIDLTKSTISILGNDHGIRFHLDVAQLASWRDAPGVVPVVVAIRPLADLREFLQAS